MTCITSLEILLQYKNPLVIKRFKRNYPEYQHQADELFEDMLKYLWLSHQHNHDVTSQPDNSSLQFNMVMHKEMRIVDEMWHTFILITKDYADFCQRYFGTFLHHVPEVGDEVDENQSIDLSQFTNELRLFLEYTYDQLGEATVKRWFATYLQN